MAQTIGIIQIKGGAGRSTLATNLSALLAERNTVALIDADMPQGTSAAWASIRLADKPHSLTLATTTTYQDLVEQVSRLAPHHDYVIIDTPPRGAEMTRAALILSDLCLVPLTASAAEIWATSDLLATIHEAREVRSDVDVRLIWTRFRGNTRSAQELSAVAQQELGLKELKNKLGYRVAFSEALARGLSVLEWPDRTARVEFQAVGKEIKKILEGKR
ncbi:MAG: AAA family ATPase [Ferrovum sp.]|nr:AAA family ATPase [Ferrovum sp.]